jgi:tetratricopeptide (TPR) repeat protein
MAVRLNALHAAAWFASDQHDYARAIRLFEQTMPLRRELGQTEGEIDLLLNAARQARFIGEYHEATLLLQGVVEQYRSFGHTTPGLSPFEYGQALRELGLVLRERGEFGRASALFEEGLHFHQSMGDREGVALAMLGLADVARDRGDAAEVREYGEESLAIFRELGMQWAVGFALNTLAQRVHQTGNLTGGLAFASESVALFRSLQADGSIAEVLITLGHITRALGDIAASEKALFEALRLAQVVGPRLLVAAALEGLASVKVLSGGANMTVRLLSAASALRAQMGTPVRPADQPALNRALSMAQSTLGAEDFASIWAEAQGLPLEAILNLETSGAVQPSSSWRVQETNDDIDATSARTI